MLALPCVMIKPVAFETVPAKRGWRVSKQPVKEVERFKNLIYLGKPFNLCKPFNSSCGLMSILGAQDNL